VTEVLPSEFTAKTEPVFGQLLVQRTWLVSLSAVIILVVYPINMRLTRVCLLSSIFSTWLCLVVWDWRVKAIRAAVLTIPLVALIFCALPVRNADPANMGANYVAALRRYEGTRYIWGGENGLGVDCSGLVRGGIIHANICCGLRTFNPALVREGLFVWWNRCSARELKDGYRGRTQFVLSARSINDLDTAQLLPGDLAVTSDGVHVLAYVGSTTWIEADPGVGRVVKETVPSPENIWFTLPVNIVRWRQLES
jgi:NlpC/P60 family